ncbi:MAG: nitrate/nitrite transporter NrtS [Ktedonobacteraceae bacterium]|nr:nitrate/nitrite transporter NrtS [Ktedonobacteraceae bacterium]
MNGAPTTGSKGPSNLRLLAGYCLERDTLRRSVKTALVVGSILALINHGQQFLSGQFSASWIIPMLVTYLVPFSVATYGQVQAKRQRDLLHASSPPISHHPPANLDKAHSRALADLDTVPMRTPASIRTFSPIFLPHK